MTPLEAEICASALNIGFAQCGFAKIAPIEDCKERYIEWLKGGNAANMSYLANAHTRFDPTQLVEGARSVIVLLVPYQPVKSAFPKIASYANYYDYHTRIYKMLNELIATLPKGVHRACCDSLPLAERSWAVRAGLGWIGKSGMLINSELGSYTFIGAIVTTLDLGQTGAVENRCGECSECVTHCPTGANLGNGMIDARRCLSYHTIESRDDVPQELQQMASGVLFGCDACLEACPWNKNASQNATPLVKIGGLEHIDWRNITSSTLKHQLKDTPFARAGVRKLRNRAVQIYKDKECI